MQLGAYLLLLVSVAGDYYTHWTDEFFILGLVALPVIAFGGIWLGILLLRRGFRPRVTAWLLIAFFRLFFAITEVTSMGNALLPFMWAGRRRQPIDRVDLDASGDPGTRARRSLTRPTAEERYAGCRRPGLPLHRCVAHGRAMHAGDG